jgi:hypothetical protein
MILIEAFPIIFVIAFMYILFAPIYIILDSSKNLYQIEVLRLAKVKIIPHDHDLFLEYKIAFWSTRSNLFTQKKEKKQPSKNTLARKKKSISFNKLHAVWRSFKVKQFSVDVDFGNPQVNGILYPVFLMASKWTNKEIMINFEGTNSVKVKFENSIARMLWAYIFN